MQNTMNSWDDLFKDKKITIMGLGLLGRGIGDADYLAKAGAIVTVTDLKTKEQLAASVKKLAKYKNVRFVLGEHRLEDFRDIDMVIKAAGVPLDSPFVVEALTHGVPVLMSTSLFAKLTPAQIVGVTGTRGKSTVTDIVYRGLERSGQYRNVFLGGNVLGVSTLSLLPEAMPGDVIALELDSWQLQGFASIHTNKISQKQIIEKGGFSPHVAVFTTFMPDHMNYYKGDMARYFADKAHIYRFQQTNDTLVVSKQVATYMKKYGPKPKGNVVIATEKDIPRGWKIRLPGEHNRLNIALAIAALRAMNVSQGVIKKTIESYRGLPGRLELVRSIKGVDFYNDTNSTTPDATMAALNAFTDKASQKKTVLIFGGADKKLDMKKCLALIPKKVKALVVLPGTGTDLIKKSLEKMDKKGTRKIPVVFVESMKDAVREAYMRTRKGDRVVMSPGFASFGLFKNEYDRGDQFNAVVKKVR